MLIILCTTLLCWYIIEIESIMRFVGHVLEAVDPLGRTCPRGYMSCRKEIKEMSNLILINLETVMNNELRPMCPRCKGLQTVTSQGFGGKPMEMTCSVCRGKGTLLLNPEELTMYVEFLRTELRNKK